MHRFFLPPDQTRAATFQFEGREAHHAINVLRLKTGEEVSVLDGAGREYLCRVSKVSKRSIELESRQTRFTPPDDFQVTLIQAIPKGPAWENILQKATELGAHAIVPLLTERVVIHLHNEDAQAKIEKWKLIAIDAIKQCGNPWLPRIDPPRRLNEILKSSRKFDLVLIASLLPNTVHPREPFREYAQRHAANPRSVAVWIGPEGDFTPDEVRQIVEHGAHPITLGPRVLRSDTAAIYCLAMIQYELRAGEGQAGEEPDHEVS